MSNILKYLFIVCSLSSLQVYSGSIAVPSDINYQVYTFERAFPGIGVIKQKKGVMQIPDEKNVIVAFNAINRKNLWQYSSMIKKVIDSEPDVYISLTVPGLNLLNGLGEQCPPIKNLSVWIIVDDLEKVNFSGFKKLSRLRVAAGCKNGRKVIRTGKLLNFKISKNEQVYLDQVVASACSSQVITELSIKARYLPINLPALNNKKLKKLSIDAGKLSLPDNLANIDDLAVSYMEMVNQEKSLKSFHSLKQLELTSVDLPTVFSLPDYPELRRLSLAFNEFSVVKLGNMPKLEQFCADHCSNLKKIQGLADLKHLKSVDISYCTNIDNLSFLPLNSPLEKLNIASCVTITNFKILSHLAFLKTIIVSHMHFENVLNKIKKNTKPGCKIVSDIDL